MVKTKKILLFCVIGLQISFYASMYCFYHTHDLSWGRIAHSHPYSSANHTHTANDLQIIHNFTNSFFTGLATFFCFTFFLAVILFFTLENRQLTTLLLIRCNQGRAPPIKLLPL